MTQRIQPSHTGRYIVRLDERSLPNSIGNKAAQLRILFDKHFQIPLTHVCTWNAYLDHFDPNSSVLEQLRNEINQIIDPLKLYAVRSSANLEDNLNHSFAGQFCTYLDVQGTSSILKAIQSVWENARSEAVKTYSTKKTVNSQEIKMAVIIQEMVTPVYSGVSFSKDPITSMDEVVVEAVIGKGTSLVQDGITPLRWINKWGGWMHQPEDSPVRLELVQEIVDQTRQIAKAIKKDLDLEWVYNGERLYWVQMRDITSTNRETMYSSKIAKEMSPGLIKPLVWSVSIPIPVKFWIGMIFEATGKNEITVENLIKAIHYRAYYNMGLFGDLFEDLGLPRESLEMMMGVLPPGAGKPPMKLTPQVIKLFPRLLRFIYDKWTFAKRFEDNFQRLFDQAHKIPLEVPQDLSDSQILSKIDQIMALNQEITYYAKLSILLMQIYNGLLRSRLRKLNLDFQNFDIVADMPDLDDYDPNNKLKILHEQYLQLNPEARAVIERGDYHEFLGLEDIGDFKKGVAEFFELFGHLSDTTTNFSTVPWRETPGFILELIANYRPPKENDQRISYAGLPSKSWQLRLFYDRSRQFRLFREESSSLYTYSLMLARAYYLALADRMVVKGFLRDREDIFYLYDNELRGFVTGQSSGNTFVDLTCQRKVEMEQARDAILPDTIFGDEIPLILPASDNKLSGTPTSKGYYTGFVRVVVGLQDFEKLNPGDVLVIPYSDAGWTPLFAKAGAVIAESGGILSHSSIIAREYNIPAVVSVAMATQLKDGMLVTVDGYKGEVFIHENNFGPNALTIVGECAEEKNVQV